MILELAGHGPDLIQVTAQYSNAVLVALLPYFSDVSHKLDLPVPQPISVQNVIDCRIMPYRYPNGDMLGAGIKVQGGWWLGFTWGYVDLVESSHSYFTLQDPEEVPNFFGTVRMSKDEAIQMARDAIKKMGIPLELVFAEQEPRVTEPIKVRSHIVPRYRIQWLFPYSAGSESADIEIDADAKRVERIRLSLNENLRRPPPKIDVPTPLARVRPHVNPEYAWKLLPIVLRAVDDYSKTLGLPIPRPLTTNHVARFEVGDNGGWPHSELELTNGWQFVYRNSMVNGYYAPDNLFHFRRSGQITLIKDYAGKWNMTEDQAIALVKRTIAKLNHPTNLVHMDFRPEVHKPAVPGIPRYWLWWNYEPNDELQSKAEAEVDADKGELKSLYFDNSAFWNKPPPIDVPISLPMSVETNRVSPKASASLKPP